MKKILSIKDAIRVAKKIKEQGKTIVIVGGFFDILHLGHIKFLENSKKYGDYLFVLLEEDNKATKKKGKERPINTQKIRAQILAALQYTDYIVMLENMTSDRSYDKIMIEICPNVIAVTYGDLYIANKKKQAELTRAKIVYVIKRIRDHSTTNYIKLIK